MRSRNLLWFMLVAIFFVALLPINNVSAAETTLTIPGWRSTDDSIHVGMTITVDVDVSDVTDLYGWELKMSYDTDVLTATGASEGAFLQGGGTTFFKVQEINDVEGYIWVYCTLWSALSGVSGDGTLVTISLNVDAEGVSPLGLYDTKLSDSQARSIPHLTVDSYFRSDTFLGVIIGTPEQPVIGDVFSVDVDISIANIYGYEFKLGFDPAVLEVIDLECVPFLDPPTYEVKCEYDNELGMVWVAVTSIYPAEPITGGGTVAKITFRVIGPGWTLLDLYEDKLATIGGLSIPHMTEDYLFKIIGRVEVTWAWAWVWHFRWWMEGRIFWFFARLKNMEDPATIDLPGVYARAVMDIMTPEGMPMKLTSRTVYLESGESRWVWDIQWEITETMAGTYEIMVYSEFGYDGVSFPFVGSEIHTFSVTIMPRHWHH